VAVGALLDVPESYCLTDGRFLAAIRAAYSAGFEVTAYDRKPYLPHGPYRANQILLGRCAFNTCR
jgi:hypothetical protein